MSRLKSLEFQRLLKELQFVESDYLFQSEILKQSEIGFFESVTLILNKYPDLKNLWEDKKNNHLQRHESQLSNPIKSDTLRPVIEPEVKKLYRDIVKHTHPDRIKNPKLNELYLEATAAYEVNDVVNLFKVCNDLMIDVEWSDEVFSKIDERIKMLKQQINFLESTFTFKWIKCSNESDKNTIVLRYIENSIR